MNKAQRLLWPLLIIVGLLVVFIIDAGNGLSSPGFWLIPVGIIGGLLTTSNRLGISKTKYLILIWTLALISFAVMLYLLFFGEGFDALDWILPTAALNIAGVITLIVYSLKE